MNRLVKIKLPKPRIAYALSAALIISMSPVPAFASGSLDTSTSDNVQNSIQVNTVTGGTIGTTTGGSVTTGGVVSHKCELKQAILVKLLYGTRYSGFFGIAFFLTNNVNTFYL